MEEDDNSICCRTTRRKSNDVKDAAVFNDAIEYGLANVTDAFQRNLLTPCLQFKGLTLQFRKYSTSEASPCALQVIGEMLQRLTASDRYD